MKLLILVAAVTLSFPVFASDKENCEAALSVGINHEFKIVPSARIEEDADKYKPYVHELTGPGGITDRLGIRMTGQVIEFLQPNDLNAMTSGSAGGYPVRHYLDGAAVLNSYNPSGGFALEVVYPGLHYQHGFYRDDNSYEQQVSIIDHVIGHNSFAFNSGLSHYRAGQGLESSRHLDEVLERAYEQYDKDDVQRYYLFTQTLTPLMDYYTPYFQGSKEFEPSHNMGHIDPLGRNKIVVRNHPPTATENVLQAFTGNIAAHEPTYKRDILEKQILSLAFRPALVHTQIMNEGWASIMQEIIPPHSGNHNFAYWVKAMQVMQSESQPNLRDPYSLGVACWRRIRERFNQQPEIKALRTRLEKDRAFMIYAQDEIIGRMDDSKFLRFAVDQVFVDRFRLAVVRKAGQNEYKEIGPPPDPQNQQQYTILSRDAERVVEMIIDQVLKPKFYYRPRVRLVNFNRPGSGEVELVLKDNVSDSLALEKPTLAPSLYALANIIGKPVSLEGNVLVQGPDVAIDPNADEDLWGGRQQNQPKQQQQLVRARVVVSPNGEVRSYRITEERDASAYQINDRTRMAPLREDPDDDLNSEMEAHLRAYIEDLYLEDEKLSDHIISGSQSLRQWKNETIAKMIDEAPYSGMASQAPGAAAAILEYKSMVERRMLSALDRAMKTGKGVAMGSKGIRLRVLPQEVNIGFDRQYMQSVLESIPPAPHKVMSLNRTEERSPELTVQSAFSPDQGQGGVVGGPIHGEVGDNMWGPSQPPGGGKPVQPGEDPNDPSWVDIPQDLYSKYLSEKVKLPVLNHKPGNSRTKKYKPGGRRNRMYGEALPLEIVENALKRGVGVRVGEGVDDPFNDIDQTIDAGFQNMLPRDWVVKSKKVTKKPDIRAVVVFVRDNSASTSAYNEAFKRFVNDMKALIQANYKGFDFRFVVFDTQAHLLKNEQEFYRFELGGGTSYSVGIKRAEKLMEDEYPRSQWDRYTFVLGDMEDYAQPAFADMKQLLDNSEYLGLVAGLSGYQWPEGLLDPVKAESQNNEFFGYTELNDDGTYELRNLKEVLKDVKEE